MHFRNIPVLYLALGLVTVGVIDRVISHDHHGHSHEAEADPAHKYSRQANEEASKHAHVHEHHGHSHGEHGHSHEHHGHAKPKFQAVSTEIIVKAFLSTLGISLAPVVILFFVRIEDIKAQQGMLRNLLAFASGGLLGDAFLHLIPHSFSSGGDSEEELHHGHSHGGPASQFDSIKVGLWVLAGLVSFLLVEMAMRAMNEGEGHGHSHTSTSARNIGAKAPLDDSPDPISAKRARSDSEDKPEKSGDVKKKSSKKTAAPPQKIEVAGYLNLAADFSHNLTDGLAIGAGFLIGENIGIMTAITVVLHEVPHEIGDYAILIKSGCSHWRAVCLQLVTAIGAMLGTALAIFGAEKDAANWILPFTAGGFIYIATVTVLPELLKEPKVSQIFFLLLGIFLMFLIGLYE